MHTDYKNKELILLLKNLIKNFKIKKKDNLMIHSDVFSIIKNFNSPKKTKLINFVSIFKNAVGKDGSLLIPAYNYEFIKGKTFDPLNSESHVGYLSNFLLNSKKYPVTNDPIFRHIVIGKIIKKIKNLNDYELFGKKSIFDFILKNKFKILCFCCSPNKMTFIHYIEKQQNVSYRFDKEVEGKIIINKKIKNKKIKYFFGKKKINYNIKHKNLIGILNKRFFLIEKFLGFNCYLIKATDLFKLITLRIKKKENCLIAKK